jgi:hypothetical protein
MSGFQFSSFSVSRPELTDVKFCPDPTPSPVSPRIGPEDGDEAVSLRP